MSRRLKDRGRHAVAAVSVAWLSVSAGAWLTPAPCRAQGGIVDCVAEATFFPRGDHWARVPPVRQNPIIVTHQKDGPIQSPPVSFEAARAAVWKAFSKWMDLRCDGGSPVNIAFKEDGVTYAPRDRGDDFSSDDFNAWRTRNVVYWVEDAAAWSADRLTVALTTVLSTNDTGFVITADLAFNGVNFNWRTVHNGAAAGCARGTDSCYDIFSVALHEVGHFLGFDHVRCLDAVMYPNGAPTLEHVELSEHEAAGACYVYRPRDSAVADRDTGEACSNTAQCPSVPAHVCIQPTGLSGGSPFGWCAAKCVSTADCSYGYTCETHPEGTRYCKPGAHLEGRGPGDCGADQWQCPDQSCIQATLRCDGRPDCFEGADERNCGGASGPLDDDTQALGDLCAPCTEGSHCGSGICLSDGQGNSMCTQRCLDVSPFGCPTGFDCVGTASGFSACWPESGSACPADPDIRLQLGQTCYRQFDDFGQPWSAACGPGLVCMRFKERGILGQVGACLDYCNAGDGPRACPEGMTCCNRIDPVTGECIPPSPGFDHGACLIIRREGETCLLPEQGVCEQGAECLQLGLAASSARCYRRCDTAYSPFCGAEQVCVDMWEVSTNRALDSCCNVATLDPFDVTTCEAGKACVFDVGVTCRRNEDCAIGKCLSYGGERVCTRSCNLVTEVGCPGDVDVNQDGIPDGGFDCRLISGEGYCWPRSGAAAVPACAGDWESSGDSRPADDEGCSCRSGSQAGHTVAMWGLFAWALVAAPWSRRRRRTARAWLDYGA